MIAKPNHRIFLKRAAMTLGRRLAMTLLFTLMTTATAWAQHQPDCCLDACTGGMELIHIAGWAYDPDAPTKSLTLELYIYADAGCTSLVAYTQNFTADVSRPDVNEAKGITGNHGFEADIPMGTAGNYWVKLFAIDTNGDGDKQIGSTTKVTVKALVATVTLNENSGDVTLQDGDVVTGTGGGNTHLMIADGATVILSNVTNTAFSDANPWPGIDCQGDATIILSGENAAKGGVQCSAIFWPSGKTLTIRGNGSLTANGEDGAGIGGGGYNACGNIVIEGGTITAIGDKLMYGPGIGGMYCGDIIITGGNVTAIGGFQAPGIGAIHGSCGNITITGGTVTAIAGNYNHSGLANFAAGIGSGGEGGSCGNIIITGGTIVATGKRESAGIGSGWACSCGNITITDGVTSVTATAGEGAPYCIGAGLSDEYGTSTCGTVTINGFETGNVAQSTYTYVPSETIICTVTFDANGGTGTMANQIIYSNIPLPLTANSFKHPRYIFTGWNTAVDGSGTGYDNGQDGQAIATASSVTLYAQWSGDYIELQDAQTNDIELRDNQTISGTGGGDIHITIADGATVRLSGVDITQIDSKHRWAGITCLGDATIILADGSTNNVKGGRRSAGIFVPEGKTLTICGDGSLTAMGKAYAAGIGGNSQTSCGNIVIEGGTVAATSGGYAAGIGSGWEASCGDITITGSSVTATGVLNAAGIGCGWEASCGDITITGGSITAVSEGLATAIGCTSSYSSDPSSCGNITITGGVTSVIATKTNKSDKVHIIGSCGTYGTCGTITIDPSLIDVLSNNNMTRMFYHGMVLFDDNNNATAIEANDDGATHDAQLRGRTLYKDGDWNTICLPFDVTISGSPLEGATIMELDTDGEHEGHKTGLDSDGTLYLYFKETTSIKAGMPYLVKWDSGDNIVNPVFSGVTVSNTPAATVTANNTGLNPVQFIGTYSPVELTIGDKNNLLLGAANSLFWPNASNVDPADEKYHLYSCRAYFHVDLNGSVNGVRAFNIGFSDNNTTGIIDNKRETINNNHWYTLDGRMLSGKPTAKGIYINNGIKVVIK